MQDSFSIIGYKMLKLAIRLDDITSDMNWDNFLKFKEITDRFGIKLLLGVVPENMDDMLNIEGTTAPYGEEGDFWAYIKSLQDAGDVIAMHGVNHIYTTAKGGIFPLNNFSEFAGLPYEEQYELLSYGVDIFNNREITTDIFMAPGHSYDKNTLSALHALGFTKVTDGFGASPYLYGNMTFYPISFIRRFTMQKKDGYSTLVYHTNNMKKEDFEALERLLEGQGQYEIISYSDYLAADVKKQGAFGRIAEYWMAKCKHILGRLL